MKSQLKVGDGFDERSTCGPLINAKAVEKVKHHLKDIKAKGGRILLEGSSKGNFIDPVIAADITLSMEVGIVMTFFLRHYYVIMTSLNKLVSQTVKE